MGRTRGEKNLADLIVNMDERGSLAAHPRRRGGVAAWDGHAARRTWPTSS